MDQPDLFDAADARSLLDQLIEDSRLYQTSQDYKDLLDFVVRLRNFAPFNAMLLQVQKPGLGFAASARDWRDRFGRSIAEGARPLLILWPFGPVGLVYDVADTVGPPLPEDVFPFSAQGSVGKEQIDAVRAHLVDAEIESVEIDAGDNRAGSIRVVQPAKGDKERTIYRLRINKNHPPPVQFVTIAHELGHLYLGHLGKERARRIPGRAHVPDAQQELEAESVSYIVCSRNGVSSKAQTYLSEYVKDRAMVDSLDFYQVMRAAGRVEAAMGLAVHTRFEKA